MHHDGLTITLRSLPAALSRRGLVSFLVGGLLAAGEDTVDAKKKRKRKKRKQRKKGPSTQVDVRCAGETLTFFVSNGDTRFAQTFNAGRSGALARVDLQVNKDPGTSGDYVLQLGAVDAFGTPTNEVLATTSAANAEVPDRVSQVSFAFAQPFTLVAGTRYALVLTRPGSTNLEWQGLQGDFCPGNVFESPDRTGPFKPTADRDLIFTTFVRS